MTDADIWRRRHPVLENMEFGSGRQGHTHVFVIVSEDEMIHIIY